MANEHGSEQVRTQVDAIYRAESRRIFATLIRLLGDFDLAEDALHEAFRVAMEQWPRDGVPSSPRAWLVSTGRFKAIDNLRLGLQRCGFRQALNKRSDEMGKTKSGWREAPRPLYVNRFVFVVQSGIGNRKAR